MTFLKNKRFRLAVGFVVEIISILTVLGLLLYAAMTSGCYKPEPRQHTSKRNARVCHETRKLANAVFAECRTQHLQCLASCQGRREFEQENCATYECLTAAFTCAASAIGFEQRDQICIRPLVASVVAGPSNGADFDRDALP